MGSANEIDLRWVRDWVTEAGRIALDYRFQADVRFKDDGTPTTSADREIESYLLDRIGQRYPHHQILGEEGDPRQGEGDFIWAIDPIDGSRAFASGLPVWGISVGVLWHGEAHAGVFFMPALGEMYWGSSEGAFCNGKPMLQPRGMGFENSLAFMAVPSNVHRLYEVNFPRIRSLGSTAAHLVYVARGAAIGALTRRVKIWDIAGVLPILEQTGCTLIYLSGKPFHASDLLGSCSAAEPLVAAHSSLIERVRTCFSVRQGQQMAEPPDCMARPTCSFGKRSKESAAPSL